MDLNHHKPKWRMKSLESVVLLLGLNCQVKCNKVSKKTSVGDFHPRHFLGRWFILSMNSSKYEASNEFISTDFGQYSRINSFGREAEVPDSVSNEL